MSDALAIKSKNFLKELRKLPRNEKIFIAESLESDLLSEWDDYDNSVEVKERIALALHECDTGETVNLNDIL